MRSAVTAAAGQSGGAVSFSDEIICLMTLMGKLDWSQRSGTEKCWEARSVRADALKVIRGKKIKGPMVVKMWRARIIVLVDYFLCVTKGRDAEKAEKVEVEIAFQHLLGKTKVLDW